MSNSNTFFDDFQDDDLGSYSIPVATFSHGQKKFEKREPDSRAEELFSEPCGKCNGNGRIRAYGHIEAGVCFQCNGAGVQLFKTPKATRVANNEKAKARKEAKAEQALADFEAAWPDIAKWWNGSTFEFAISLREAVRKYGDLTPGQMAAALKCVNKIKALKEARETRVAAAPVIEINHVNDCLSRAREKGIKRPKMRLLGNDRALTFSRAPDHGVNAGAVYVNEDDLYLGKITQGKFVRARDCSDDMEKDVLAACAHPLDSAVAYGKRYNNCSCCGKELTNAESIDLGIGPVCRAKFF